MFRAGETFPRYVRQCPDRVQCPSCGSIEAVTCEDCGEILTSRQHIAADFVIGGHAAADAQALVTFDAAFYETYFPEVPVLPE